MRGCALLLFAIASCDATPPIGVVPPKPNASASTSTSVVTFAIDRLSLGDEHRVVNATDTTWQSLGYNLDGVITPDGRSPTVCGGSKYALGHNDDGLNGIDNNWASDPLFLIEYGVGSAQPSTDATTRIASGAWTLELQVSGLSGDPNQTALGIDVQAFVGAPFDAPTFDTTMDWPVVPSSLADGSTIANGARVHFDSVYVTHGTIVATDATAPLVLPIALLNHFDHPPKPPEPVVLTIRIHRPIVTFGVDGSNGIIAGVLDAQETSDLARDFARHLNNSTCGTAWDDFESQILGAQDILADGTNAPNVPCSAISIGLGFDARQIANPTRVGVEPLPTSDLCGDAGAE